MGTSVREFQTKELTELLHRLSAYFCRGIRVRLTPIYYLATLDVADDGTPSLGMPVARSDSILVTPDLDDKGYAVVLSGYWRSEQVVLNNATTDEVYDFLVGVLKF